MYSFTADLPGLLAIAIQVVLPLLVGLVGSRLAGGAKAVLLLALTAVNQFLVGWADAVNAHHGFAWQGLLLNVVVGFVVSVATHYGLWKASGVSAKVQALTARKSA